jgi:hypothetical protein
VARFRQGSFACTAGGTFSARFFCMHHSGTCSAGFACLRRSCKLRRLKRNRQCPDDSHVSQWSIVDAQRFLEECLHQHKSKACSPVRMTLSDTRPVCDLNLSCADLRGQAPPAVLITVCDKVLVRAIVLVERIEVGALPRVVGVEISGIATFRARYSEEWKWTVDCWGGTFCVQNDRQTCPGVAISLRRKLLQTQ